MNYDDRSIAMHKKFKGKLEVRSKVLVKDKEDLSLAYTPGVAAVSRLIVKDKRASFTHTLRGNTVAVVSDGSAILGLGNLGPEAALPVMEGKAVLFKTFGNVDAFPICLASQDTEEIIKAVKMIAPSFGGINLEDIAAPRCFEIEERLKRELDIPVFHDDQHGTAIVVLAALYNALKVVKKDISKINVVMSGAGAAATATAKLFIKAGVDGKKILILDSKGVIVESRKDLNKDKVILAKLTNGKKVAGGLKESLVDADVFVGVSAPNVLKPEWVTLMAENPIVFAMANPNPEITYELAKKTKIKVFGTGRSDYPNQINNVLVFPGIFRGALDAGAKAITDEMKLSAAKAIASIVSSKELKAEYVIPRPFDTRVAKAVASAVKRAVKTGIKK